MRKTASLLLLLFGIFAFGQVKTDSLLQFFNYSTPDKSYIHDFDQKIRNDSTLYYTLDSLKTAGFYSLTFDSIKEKKVYINKGRLYKSIWVKNDSIFHQNEDWFKVRDMDSLVQSVNIYFAERGFPFVEVKVIPLGYKEDLASIRLETRAFAQRRIDKIKVEEYDKLSKAYLRYNLGLKIGEVYNETQLNDLSEKLAYNKMIEEIKPPQTLFHTDSTTVYLYVKKLKSNYFDGILGFGNDAEGKFKLNGDVKVELNNNFNGMEKISLHWLSTSEKNTSLDLNVTVPYLFRSPVGTQSTLNIFRQDSVYVNTRFEERLFYQLTPNSNIGVNLSYENSNFVLKDNPAFSELYDDYNKTGIGISYDLLQPSVNRLFEGNSGLYVIGRSMNRKRSLRQEGTLEWFDEKERQYEVGARLFRLFRLHPKHYVKAAAEGFGLYAKSGSFTLNELFRIGGFNSLRGFNEKSILASSYIIGSLEYRFVPNEGFFISLFGDYATAENKPADITTHFFGFGTGLSFLTELGVFNISYAVGKQSDTDFDFKNSKIHFGILTRF